MDMKRQKRDVYLFISLSKGSMGAFPGCLAVALPERIKIALGLSHGHVFPGTNRFSIFFFHFISYFGQAQAF